MSHFTRLKTRMVEKEFLKGALEDLGYRYEEGKLAIKGFGFARTEVELKIPAPLFGCEIGFRKAGDAYEMVADWYGVRGTKREQLVGELTRNYARRAAISQLEKQGFSLASEEEEKGGRIHLVLRRMA